CAERPRLSACLPRVETPSPARGGGLGWGREQRPVHRQPPCSTGGRHMSFDPRRREALKAAALAAVAGSAGAVGLARADGPAGGNAEPPVTRTSGHAAAASTAATPSPGWDALRLWYPRPATQWVEALPLGNGRLGAMVWGGGKHERIQ